MIKRLAMVWLMATIGALGQNVKVMMLSDPHFDPLHDPAKAERLAAAPVEQWDGILKQPDSAGQAESFRALQTECHARGVDSDYTVLSASLNAAKAQSAGAAFVTVTGDLLVHNIDCRYDKLLKDKDKDGYAAFAEKTAVFVMRSVQAAFPGVPVYIAGGNNDSACGDYRMDEPDKYFEATRSVEMAGLHNAAQARRAAAGYDKDGEFSVMVPGLKKTRLLVLDDIYLAVNYSDCAGQPSKAGADAELAWLDRELSQVKARGEQAWVIGHIPPGVNVYSTLAKGGDVCTGMKVKLLLSSDGLAETLVKHADVVRLALFAHTHFDEIRLLGGKVPMKLVSSVSPINGNRPTFTVAEVDRKTATLEDYSVFEASNRTGADTTWSKEYSYRETYGEKDFSGASVVDLVGKLQGDPVGLKAESRTYETNFAPGMLPVLGLVWPKYACALTHTTEESYKSCACGTR
jgi:sphingomyelin phosphodiesterase acid-like 3